MFLLRQKWRISLVCSVVPQTLDLMFVHKLAVAQWDLKVHSTRASGPTSFLEKAQTRSCLITSKHVSRVEEVKKPFSTFTNHFRLLQTLFKGAHYPSSHMGSTSNTSKYVQHLLSLPLPVPRQTLTHFIQPCTSLSLSPLNGKTLGLFLPIPLVCIKWSQSVYYLFWIKMLS